MGAKPVVAVVMPAYNEEGLAGFLVEIEAWLHPVTDDLFFVVVDDCSTVPLDLVAPVSTLPLGSKVRVVRSETNQGHGPTAVAAYRHGIASACDVVLHVDGDGQFLGEDFPRLLEALAGRDGVVASRAGRREPWFRRVLTRVARLTVGQGLTGHDVNSPLRAYRVPTVEQLLARLPESPVVPHLHFALLHDRLGLDVVEIPATHRPRRGVSTTGTTWQSRRLATVVPSRRLVALAWSAWRELRAQQVSERSDVHPIARTADAV
jgi:glycosyltransferase involved in cell wall biosynthesis